MLAYRPVRSKPTSPAHPRQRETISGVNLRKRTFPSVLLGLGLGAALLMSVSAFPTPAGSIVENLLTQKLRFSDADLRALDTGSAVIKSLDTPIREELAHVGAVYLDAPSGRFVERFRDIVRFESGPGIPQIGRFGSPPMLEDLASLTLPPTDVTTLRTCRPGDCDVKLSAAAMRRFRDEVD
jgi:hypothetical protein